MPKDFGIDISSNLWHPFDSRKVLCHAKRMEAIVNEHYLPPVVMNLDVTGKCQYRCGHCHHRRKQVHDRRLPDLSKKLADTLPYFLSYWQVDGERVLACCIVGSQGDALLYDGLGKLLKELHFAGVEIGLVTNGYAFNDDLIVQATAYSKFIGFSMDAGTKDTYNKVKNCPEDAWSRVLINVQMAVNLCESISGRNDVGWKFLILPDNQNEIYESCKIAKDAGCRYVQIRPADLPEADRTRISISLVENQIANAIEKLEEPGKFEIVGIRHKFTPDYKKVLPKYCYLTPLTVTVTSDGKVYACVDRRCDAKTLIADCDAYGWTRLKENWGSSTHVSIVRNIINNLGRGPDCDIRCSNYGYDKFFNNFFVQDNVDWKLI